MQLVAGRQNQNRANNQQFAEGIKKQADENFPISKGYFYGTRQLQPRYVTPRYPIEVGSHTNDKAQAEETMYLFLGSSE